MLLESRAIGRYLALKYADQGTPRIPSTSDLIKMGIFEQAASVETSDFDNGEDYLSVSINTDIAVGRHLLTCG